MNSSECVLNYKVIWTIEKFASIARPFKKSLTCVPFVTETIKKIEWTLWIYPYGRSIENYVACLLKTYIPEINSFANISVGIKIKINVVGVKNEFTYIISDKYLDGAAIAFGKDDFINRTFFDNPNLQDRDLIIECNIDFNNQLTSDNLISHRNELEKLSVNMLELYERVENTDLTLFVDGLQFKCHKFVIEGRSSDLCQLLENNDINAIGVNNYMPAYIFSVFLKYLYSGHMLDSDNTELFRSCTANFSHLFRTDTITKTLMAKTLTLVENSSIKLDLKKLFGSDLKTFQLNIPFSDLSATSLFLTLTPSVQNDEKSINITFQLYRPEYFRYIRIYCKASLYHDDELINFEKDSYIFKNRDEHPFSENWNFPQFAYKIYSKGLITESIHLLLEISMYECRKKPYAKSVECEISPGLRYFANLQLISDDMKDVYLGNDATKNLKFNSTADSEKWAHSALVSVRCHKLLEMHNEIVEFVNEFGLRMRMPFETSTLDFILLYIYTGKLYLNIDEYLKLGIAGYLLKNPFIVRHCMEFYETITSRLHN